MNSQIMACAYWQVLTDLPAQKNSRNSSKRVLVTHRPTGKRKTIADSQLEDAMCKLQDCRFYPLHDIALT